MVQKFQILGPLCSAIRRCFNNWRIDNLSFRFYLNQNLDCIQLNNLNNLFDLYLFFQNVRLLSQFVSPYTGRIYGSSVTGLCHPMQSRVAKLINRARRLGKIYICLVVLTEV